jgi:GDP-D-mannose dehydratase
LIKNVFITGGLGQDGKILSKLLDKKKINLNILTKSNKEIKNKKITYIKSNLLNKKKLESIFTKNKPDIVLHLGANNPSYNEDSFKLFFKDNKLTTKNIFFSTFKANKKAKFIFCSSSQIFQKKNGTVNEKSKVMSTSDYTKFRIDSHNMMLKYKKKNKIQYTNVILFNHDSKFRNKKFIIPRICKAIISKKTNFLNKIIKANISSDYSHAEDICNGLSKLMFSRLNLDKIILSSNKITSLNDIILYLIKKNNLKINVKYRKIKVKGLKGNNKLAKSKLKWSPKFNIFKAANEIYKFYKKTKI